MTDERTDAPAPIRLTPSVVTSTPGIIETELRGEDLPEFMDPSETPLILMLDIESLDVGPRSVVLQIALYGLDPDEGRLLEDNVWSFFPIQPQLDLIQPRTISAKTLLWWMQQSDEARSVFERNVGDDFESLGVLMRHLTREFRRMVGDRDYELWARGPDFDVTNVVSLYRDCGMEAPWNQDQNYHKVRDLRTLMASAGLRSSDVEKPEGFIAHRAAWDCKYQLRQWQEAQRHLRARS